MNKFKVGEIAIIKLDLGGNHLETIGRECEIIEAYPSINVYKVTIPSIKDGFDFWKAKGCELRKKPPKEETSSWEEIQKLTNWNPKKVTA